MPVTRSHTTRPVRALWFGMRCEFTWQALIGATAPGSSVEPVAIVLPRGPRPRVTGWPEPPFDRWLRERGIRIIEVDRLGGDDLAAAREAVAATRAVLGVGACFPYKVPVDLRDTFPHGVLNIHPSLLPALRGPEPVFHAYRIGLEETGVTVHMMDDGWDSGPILAQERVSTPDTGTADAFEAHLAHRGGELLARIVPGWCAGEIAPVPQDDRWATWAPTPDDAARTISSTLTVSQATRFLNACGPLLAVDECSGDLVQVASVPNGETHETWGLREDHRVVRIACIDGTLRATGHALA